MYDGSLDQITQSWVSGIHQMALNGTSKELPQRSLPPAASTPCVMRRDLRARKKTGVEWCWHVLAATSIKVSSILLAKSCNFEGWESIGPGVLGQSMLQQSTRDVVYARGWSCNAAYSDNPNTLMSRLNYSKLNSWKSVPIISHYIPIVFGQCPHFCWSKSNHFAIQDPHVAFVGKHPASPHTCAGIPPAESKQGL